MAAVTYITMIKQLSCSGSSIPYCKIIWILFLLSLVLWGQDKKELITITAAGDIMMGSVYPKPKLPPAGGKYLFDSVAAILKRGDIVFGNLEGTLSDYEGEPKGCRDTANCYRFRSPESYGGNLAAAGFNLMSIANNHIYDFGVSGESRTRAVLGSHNIYYAGTLNKPYTFMRVKGKTIAFCAFAPNAGTVDINNTDSAAGLVRMLKDSADIVIVSFHGGAEGADYRRVYKGMEMYLGEKRGDLVKFAHAVIDAGADVVLGHGPHVTRAMEIYKNRVIAYSMGNFCTWGGMNISGVNGIAPLLELRINGSGEFIDGVIHPIKQIERGRPIIDKTGRAIKELRRLTSLDFPDTPLKISETGELRR